MRIPVQLFNPNRVATTAQVFSGEIDRDPWVMFHGTSGFNADAIERDGFRPSPISREEIQHVVNVYETMNWAGEHFGGLVVLKPFSLDYDLGGPVARLFFAETSRVRDARFRGRRENEVSEECLC